MTLIWSFLIRQKTRSCVRTTTTTKSNNNHDNNNKNTENNNSNNNNNNNNNNYLKFQLSGDTARVTARKRTR